MDACTFLQTLFFSHLKMFFLLLFFDQNNTYYLEVLTDNERFLNLFSTATSFFCVFTFVIIQEFLPLCTYVNDMVVISSSGEK